MKDSKKFVRHLRVEAIAYAIFMVFLVDQFYYPLWILPATFLIFDIGMIGYLKNPKLGALTYNLSHNLTAPTILIIIGLSLNTGPVQDTLWLVVIGICWSFHIAIDRAFGFGLKHDHSFKETHLGRIGK